MPLRTLQLALNCTSFDDFPTKLPTESAGNLLRCWTALWHPSLIATIESRPDIIDIDHPFDQPELIIVPAHLKSEVSSTRLKEVETQNGHIVFQPKSANRNELIDSLVAAAGTHSDSRPPIPDEQQTNLARDFLALGYGWLQVRLMTLKIRYSSDLDDEEFDEQLVEASQAWLQGDTPQANDKLTACFDLLLAEKNKYYSVQPDLIDLVLTEKTTLGPTLTRQLKQSCQHPVNVLLTGSSANKLSNSNPDATSKLQQRLEAGSACVVGGLEHELPEHLLPLESRRRQLKTGRQSMQRIFDVTPRVFLRRSFGLDPLTPSLLEQFSFSGALHVTLDGGQLPETNSSNIRWVGTDGQSVPALTTPPVDANDSASFLSLGIRLARAIDADHLASCVLAHWPAATCESFEDLQRLSAYGGLLGDFVTLDDYFEGVYDPGFGDTFTADEYRSPLLKQLLQNEAPNPVSRFVDAWGLARQFEHCQSLASTKFSRDLASQPTSDLPPDVMNELGALASEIDQSLDPNESLTDQTEANEKLRVRLAELQKELSKDQTPREPLEKTVPGGPPVDNGLTLRNEHFQIQVDEATGGVRSLQIYEERFTQVSQRLSTRISKSNNSSCYADMRATDISTKRLSGNESQIVSAGQLVDPDTKQILCDFEQTLTVRRRDRIAELEST